MEAVVRFMASRRLGRQVSIDNCDNLESVNAYANHFNPTHLVIQAMKPQDTPLSSHAIYEFQFSREVFMPVAQL